MKGQKMEVCRFEPRLFAAKPVRLRRKIRLDFTPLTLAAYHCINARRVPLIAANPSRMIAHARLIAQSYF